MWYVGVKAGQIRLRLEDSLILNEAGKFWETHLTVMDRREVVNGKGWREIRRHNGDAVKVSPSCDVQATKSKSPKVSETTSELRVGPYVSFQIHVSVLTRFVEKICSWLAFISLCRSSPQLSGNANFSTVHALSRALSMSP